MSVLQDPVRNGQLGRRGGRVMRCWKGIAYPDVEVEIPVGDGLDVESNSRYRRNHLSNLYSHQYSDPPNFQRLRGRQASYLQSVEKCGLPSVILEPRVSSLYDAGEEGKGRKYQTQDQDPDLLLRPQQPRQPGHAGTHLCWPFLGAVSPPLSFLKKCPSHKHLAP